MAKKDVMVKVRILPGRGIGGVGFAGQVVSMSQEDADAYKKDGYVEIVDEEAAQQPLPVASSVPSDAKPAVAREKVGFLDKILGKGKAEEPEAPEGPDGASTAPSAPLSEEAAQIMKPETKRL